MDFKHWILSETPIRLGTRSHYAKSPLWKAQSSQKDMAEKGYQGEDLAGRALGAIFKGPVDAMNAATPQSSQPAYAQGIDWKRYYGDVNKKEGEDFKTFEFTAEQDWLELNKIKMNDGTLLRGILKEIKQKWSASPEIRNQIKDFNLNPVYAPKPELLSVKPGTDGLPPLQIVVRVYKNPSYSDKQIEPWRTAEKTPEETPVKVLRRKRKRT